MIEDQKKYKNQVEENEEFRIGRNDARRTAPAAPRGVAITEVNEGSIAEELGIEPGDQLLQINDAPARDIVQLKMADLSQRISLTILGRDGTPQNYVIEKDLDEPLGLGMDAELFDGVKRCTNKCPFCFVDALPDRVKQSLPGAPKNLRRTLYVRDDDFRLSFLHGHFITLTNLKDADYERIIRERMSPLCVSVHATDPAVRRRMVGNAKGGEIMERMQFLIDNGIQLNTQIVLCPGWNDGEILERSISDLVGLWPGVESVAVVPVGLTKYLPNDRGMKSLEPHQAQQVLAQIKPIQRRCYERMGVRFVYASDEMYLLSGEKLPGAALYDGFPQYANGVGLVRTFVDELARLRRRQAAPAGFTPPRITMVTGELAGPFLQQFADLLEEKRWAKAGVVTVKNNYWGGNVAAAGLLMGQEILPQLRGRELGEMVFLPSDAVDGKGRLLDDITLAQMSEELCTNVRSDAATPVQLVNLLHASL